ncbi:MAG: DUF1573 domain-containing protein [Pirellulales bacterium]|nr:DUF1573 domain-containing protein [Pirellulales bacterium]
MVIIRSAIFLAVIYACGAVIGWQLARQDSSQQGNFAQQLGVAELPSDPVASTEARGDQATPPSPAPENDFPRWEVTEGVEHHFGTMTISGEGAHQFKIRNVGQRPLTLKLLNTSCKCTLAQISNAEIPVGESTPVELKWTAEGRPGPFTQTAVIETNDPVRPLLRLTIKGRLAPSSLIDPTELLFTEISSGTPATAEFSLRHFILRELPQPNWKWQDASTAEYFQVEFRPLTPEELAENGVAALTGWRGIVTVRPGLPLGNFRQALLLNWPGGEIAETLIPVQGTITGAVSLVGGPNWNSDLQIYEFPEIVTREARSQGLYLLLKGDQRQVLQPRLIKAQPSFLRVEFGDPEFLTATEQTKVPVTVVVPADSPAGSHTGEGKSRAGRVMIETGIPNYPQVRIFAKFVKE